MSQQSCDTRTYLLRQVLIALLCLVMLGGGADLVNAQDEAAVVVPRRPEAVPTFVNATDLFTEEQLGLLQQDGVRLTSINIPTLVYIRNAEGDAASEASSKALADALRSEWDIASEPGADDGLVLLVTIDRLNAEGYTLALSYGDATFSESGLTPAYISSVFMHDAQPLLRDGSSYQGMYTFMRKVRYGGIYFPPPVAPLEGAAKTVHDVIAWIAPLSVIGVAATFLTLSLRSPMDGPRHRPLVARVAITVAILTLALASISVIGRSTIGVTSAALLAIALGVQLYLWTRPRPEATQPARTRVVPPASRRARRWRQARRMALGTTSGEQR